MDSCIGFCVGPALFLGRIQKGFIVFRHSFFSLNGVVQSLFASAPARKSLLAGVRSGLNAAVRLPLAQAFF